MSNHSAHVLGGTQNHEPSSEAQKPREESEQRVLAQENKTG